ncbi:MAG: hypothetical protein ABIP46_12110 [Polaromonas sp.]
MNQTAAPANLAPVVLAARVCGSGHRCNLGSPATVSSRFVDEEQ